MRSDPESPRTAAFCVDSYRVLAGAIREERSITPAAEWLVDNFHIVDEQLREIRDDLPADYYRKLPKLAEGHLEGYPRVLGLAWAYVAHTDSRFDPDSLRRMVQAYQRVEPLTIGELWATPISLRIILVENLRRMAEQIVRSRAARDRRRTSSPTACWASADDSPEAAAAIAAPARPIRRCRRPVAVQLFQRLRDQDPAVTPALGWLEELLAAQGTTAEETVRREHQRQAAMNVTVRNVITSMRLISWFDWAEFVESVSLVDEVLRAGWRLRGDGLRHAGPIPACDRGARPRVGANRGRGSPTRHGSWRSSGGRPRRCDRRLRETSVAGRRRLLPGLRWSARVRARARRPRSRGRPPAAGRMPPRRPPTWARWRSSRP